MNNAGSCRDVSLVGETVKKPVLVGILQIKYVVTGYSYAPDNGPGRFEQAKIKGIRRLFGDRQGRDGRRQQDTGMCRRGNDQRNEQILY